MGLFGVFAYNLFFMGALEKLPASRAALIIALNPAITIAISAVALREHLSARRWLGVAIALLLTPSLIVAQLVEPFGERWMT